MSLLFCCAISMARFSVRAIGWAGSLGGFCAVSWARTVPAPIRRSAMYQSPAHRIIFIGSPSLLGFLADDAILLVAQRIDRLQPCGLIGGQIPEKNARQAGHGESYHHARSGHRHTQVSWQKVLRRHGNR